LHDGIGAVGVTVGNGGAIEKNRTKISAAIPGFKCKIKIVIGAIGGSFPPNHEV
jgi:hypothetical protein